MRRRAAPSLLLLLLCGFALVMGCGQVLDLERLSSRYTQAFCSYRVECGYKPDMETCLEVWADQTGRLFGSRTRFEQITAAVKAGCVEYDPILGAACLERLENPECRLTVSDHQACDEMFRGLSGDGDACLISAECHEGYCDRRACGDATCCEGECVPVRHTAIGEACEQVGPGGLTCDPAISFCDYSQSPATCVASASVGEPCGNNTKPCRRWEAYCDYDLETDTGECRPLVWAGEGEACDDWGARCDRLDLWCNRDTGRCEKSGPSGASCAPGEGRRCQRYTYCDTDTLTCLQRPFLGDACEALREPSCNFLDCIDGVCTSTSTEVCEF